MSKNLFTGFSPLLCFVDIFFYYGANYLEKSLQTTFFGRKGM